MAGQMSREAVRGMEIHHLRRNAEGLSTVSICIGDNTPRKGCTELRLLPSSAHFMAVYRSVDALCSFYRRRYFLLNIFTAIRLLCT